LFSRHLPVCGRHCLLVLKQVAIGIPAGDCIIEIMGLHASATVPLLATRGKCKRHRQHLTTLM
jgi:hypothetical protein